MKYSMVNPDVSVKTGDEEVLRQCLERGARELFGASSPIARIERVPFKPATSYDLYRVIVRLASGGEVQLFLKDYGFSLRPKDDAKQRREREVCVYRDLLADASLGTPRYYESVMDEAQGRLWLLLEYVDGTPVGYCHRGDGWAPAAEGLGRMHGYFAPQVGRLRGCSFLIQHNADFFLSTAERALTNVSQITPHLVGRLEKLTRGYGVVVSVMTSQGQTFVHGGCRSTNILIRVANDPARVCILDWEEAGLGAALFDVAYLLDGIKSPLLDRLLEAYRHGAADYGMALPPLQEMKYAVECFRLHMAFNLLGRAVLKGYKEPDILKVLDYGESIGRTVYGQPCNHLPPSPLSLKQDGLKLTLERFVSKVQNRDVEVTGWRREPSPVAVAGVFPIDLLRVSLRGDEELSLFVKHLGPEQADHPDKQCRDREPRLYEDLLSGDGLPVPQYYGSRWNERTNRREVYLEYIGDWSLKYQELDHWFDVAPRLAQFHAHFAQRAAELQARDYLLRLNATYFGQWAERALTVAANQSSALADDLAALVNGYDRVAEMLARQPVTLVHNDLAPKNVLVDRTRHPVRICFVDWEMAGVGCGLLDLVHFKHGLEPAADQAMCAAYCAELGGTGLLPSSPLELRRLLAACELHHTLYRIAHSRLWRAPPHRVAQWVAEAREVARQVEQGEAS